METKFHSENGLTPYGRIRNSEIKNDSELISKFIEKHKEISFVFNSYNIVSKSIADEALGLLKNINSKGLIGISYSNVHPSLYNSACGLITYKAAV